MLCCTALVLLMTPGLAFFYGGMVDKKNILYTMFQSISAIAIVTCLWTFVGYVLPPSLPPFLPPSLPPSLLRRDGGQEEHSLHHAPIPFGYRHRYLDLCWVRPPSLPPSLPPSFLS